jgi:hypothetical protein
MSHTLHVTTRAQHACFATAAAVAIATLMQAQSSDVFATVGYAPGAQLRIWDARAPSARRKAAVVSGHPTAGAVYNCVANCPMMPACFVAGASTGEVRVLIGLLHVLLLSVISVMVLRTMRARNEE